MPLMPVPIYGDQNVLRTFEMVIRHVGRMMTTAYIREFSVAVFILITFRNIFSGRLTGGSVAEWLACWTQAQKGFASNHSRDAVG